MNKRRGRGTKQRRPAPNRKQVRFVKKKGVKNRKFMKANRLKMIVVFSVLIATMGGLIIRLGYINVKNGELYAKRVLDQQQNNGQIIPFRRGDIVDRNGVVLATSEKVYNIVIDAYVVNKSKVKEEGDCVEPTLEALEKYFGSYGVDVKEIREHIKENPDSRYFVAQKHLPYDAVDKYKTNMAQVDEKGRLTEGLYVALNGVWFEEEYIRKYPYGSMACDLIGFTNSGDRGAYGLEAYYNEELNGTNGREYGYMTGDSGLEQTTIAPDNGDTLVSTIDINVQQIIEKHLYEFNEAIGSKNSAVIVQDVTNGEILGMATYPEFDLNAPYDISNLFTDEKWEAMTDEEKMIARQAIWRNFTVSDTFEPGSTVKTVTVAAALDENLVTPASNYNCEGYVKFPDGDKDVTVKCNNPQGHHLLDLSGALEQSCNVALMEIGLQLGKERYSKYQKMFGFGQKTYIDLPAEVSGLLYPPEQMTELDLATNAFGQNYNVTAVQTLSAFTSIVNGGSFYRPHVVKEIKSENGSVVQSFGRELMRTTTSAETAKWMRTALEATVTEGTGKTAAVEGYRIGGKTGTAEKITWNETLEKWERDQKSMLVSFISAAPINDPKVAVYVLIDEPDTGSQADSKLPAVMTSKIYADLLPYLQIFPEGQTGETDESIDETETDETTTEDTKETIDTSETESDTPETDAEGNIIETEETLLSEEEVRQLRNDYLAIEGYKRNSVKHREHNRK